MIARNNCSRSNEMSAHHRVKSPLTITEMRMLNAVDGCIPSDLGSGTTAELEEERRLLYVAMTRAKDNLHLVVPQRFFTHGQSIQGDRHVYASRTRFIP